MTDGSQVAEGAKNRREAFVRMMEEYEPALRRLAGAYVNRAVDLEDLFQEISLAVWRALPRFRGDASERTWLYRIAHNVAISTAAGLRKRNRREPSMDHSFDCPSVAAGPEEQFVREEKRRLLLAAIRTLPGLDRLLILLHLEGLGSAEMEEISGLSQGAIATRLSRIREKLKERVGL